MAENGEKQSPKDTIKIYIAAHPEIQNKPAELKTLPIADLKKIKKTIEQFGKDSVTGYLQAVKEERLGEVNKVVIDPENEIYLEARRGAKKKEDRIINHALGINLKRNGDEISKFVLRDYTGIKSDEPNDTDFRLSHRFIAPEYRGQIKGLGTMMLKAMEDFAQEYVNQTGEGKNFDIYAAQLDVLSWLDANGYKPVADPTKSAQNIKVNSVERMEDILAFLRGENDNYHIGPDMYVFPKDVPESEFNEHDIKNSPDDKLNVDGRWPGTIAIDKSALVHFQKRFEPVRTLPQTQRIIDRTRENTIGK